MKTIKVGGVPSAIILAEEMSQGNINVTSALGLYDCVIFQHPDQVTFEVLRSFRAIEAFAVSYEIERTSSTTFKFRNDDDLINFYLQLEQV